MLWWLSLLEVWFVLVRKVGQEDKNTKQINNSSQHKKKREGEKDRERQRKEKGEVGRGGGGGRSPWFLFLFPEKRTKSVYTPPLWHPSSLGLSPDPEVTEQNSYGVYHFLGKTKEKGMHHRSGKKGIQHRGLRSLILVFWYCFGCRCFCCSLSDVGVSDVCLLTYCFIFPFCRSSCRRVVSWFSQNCLNICLIVFVRDTERNYCFDKSSLLLCYFSGFSLWWAFYLSLFLCHFYLNFLFPSLFLYLSLCYRHAQTCIH